MMEKGRGKQIENRGLKGSNTTRWTGWMAVMGFIPTAAATKLESPLPANQKSPPKAQPRADRQPLPRVTDDARYAPTRPGTGGGVRPTETLLLGALRKGWLSTPAAATTGDKLRGRLAILGACLSESSPALGGTSASGGRSSCSGLLQRRGGTRKRGKPKGKGSGAEEVMFESGKLARVPPFIPPRPRAPPRAPSRALPTGNAPADLSSPKNRFYIILLCKRHQHKSSLLGLTNYDVWQKLDCGTWNILMPQVHPRKRSDGSSWTRQPRPET